MTSILLKQINLKRISPNTYAVSWDTEWTLGTTLMGGCVAAQIHHAAATHLVTDAALAAQNQPDILSLHVEFLRPCERLDSCISITPLKVGPVACTLQLQLSQAGKLRVVALATSTNFDQSLGPDATTAWSLHPPPSPKPDFDRVLAHQPDENWIPGILDGEIISVTRRKLGLHPRAGFPVAGVCDAWNCFLADERMDATYLTMMADIIPSMSDTLMRNGGLYDAHAFQDRMERWAQNNPGIPCLLTNTIAEAMQAKTFNHTVNLDIEYKRRLPREGQQWLFSRASTKMLQGGRMDLDITMCNEHMELVAIAHQNILVLEAQRKFRKRSEVAAL
ncbi:hypothetical protein QQS21_001300 [Conoideocrella luteorostrata]|uniref:Uncharacterized protein n=1 Tax=Conoideocrella luteorostrata TaxID=1105319 RepID=A0AAJ0D077_9HYPO|nr:hypothetical protein QQS21_001300 [Conoideocrella luteorostrata]